MNTAQFDQLETVLQLLPGFLTAWIYYGFTGHTKPSIFERLIQALIFTTIIQAIMSLLRISQYQLVQAMTSDYSLATSSILALLLGFVFVAGANHDWLHRPARSLKITKHSALPSEWYSAFSRYEAWVILHLSGERRLYGWPELWPDQPTTGHFGLTDAAWMLDDNRKISIPTTKLFLVPVTEVIYVELLRGEDELEEFNLTEQAIEAENALTKLQEGDEDVDESASDAT